MYRLRVRHYAIATEKSYGSGVRKFILFHKKRHPKYMGSPEVIQFLSHLAVNRNVAASTQNQALCAIVFLYKSVLVTTFARYRSGWATVMCRPP
jgi:hypothetical protein